MLGGHGEPVDEIDRICQRFHKCISCVNLDHVDCPDWAPYTFKTNKSRASGEKNIVCKNKVQLFLNFLFLTQRRFSEALAGGTTASATERWPWTSSLSNRNTHRIFLMQTAPLTRRNFALRRRKMINPVRKRKLNKQRWNLYLE